MLNLDPAAVSGTPPIHGCLRETVVHPRCLPFKLPDNVSFGEGALVEPLAVGMQAAKKAASRPAMSSSLPAAAHRYGPRHGRARQRLHQGHHHRHSATRNLTSPPRWA